MADFPTALALGRVVEVEISERGLRARLQRLDRPDGIITDWVQVASLMAGPEVGAVFAPEVDDLAVLAFAAKRPIILGFLTGGEVGAATTELNERSIVSRDKNRVVLVDGDKSGITIEDSNGNRIVMNAEGITIKSSGEITLEASGKTAIKGATVELN
uniref:phage baseplate assembly protein V n=1 Tax=uncultured Halomonas sp. TaxID=173971 RepID=UPI00263475E9|nr:phage baseplate assembly protein V [uncultured Halomonas sp.]